jgi:hypothetical protein
MVGRMIHVVKLKYTQAMKNIIKVNHHEWRLPFGERRLLVSREYIFVFPLRNANDYFRLKMLRPDQYAMKIGFYIAAIENVN